MRCSARSSRSAASAPDSCASTTSPWAISMSRRRSAFSFTILRWYSTFAAVGTTSRSIPPSTACSASSDQGGLRSRNGSRAACGAIENSTGELDIFPCGALPRWIAEQCGGVVGDDQRHPVIAVYLTTQFTDRLRRLQESLRRERPEGKDHPGLQQLQLPQQERTACLDLVRDGVPVARRAVLQDVADEHVLASEVYCGEDLRQQLSRGADERPARLVFRGARRFADAHEPGARIPFAGDRVLRPGVQRARRARRDGLRDGVDRIEMRKRARAAVNRMPDDDALSELGTRTLRGFRWLRHLVPADLLGRRAGHRRLSLY